MAKAAEKAYSEIRQRILAGGYFVGSPLREEQLAEEIGVSRTPVREALRRLGSEGLVEFEPNRGAKVSSWSEQDLREIFGLRSLLEGYAARLAAERHEDAGYQKMCELVEKMESVRAARKRGFLHRVSELNNEFHRTILVESKNKRLGVALSAVVEIPLVHQTFRRYSEVELDRSFRHHRELLDAFRNRDGAWAESLMRAHILAAKNAIFEND